MRLTASLVLFHNDPAHYAAAIESFLRGCDGRLYVVDNSSAPLVHESLSDPRVIYTFTGRNLGFGAGHNRALEQIGRDSDLHLFLNPDVTFGPEVLPALIERFGSDKTLAALMPRIQYPDGQLQRLCKLLPTPLDLIFRRFLPFAFVRDWVNRRYEMHDLPQDRPSDVPTLSGCFLLVRTEVLQRVGGFDARYFMYMEDVDLVRRIGDWGRTVYEPSVTVTHAYGKGSYRNKKLLGYHLNSARKYFNKWGWLIDLERGRRNRRARARMKAVGPDV